MTRMDSKLGRAQLAQLHIWPKDLGLSDDVRRDVQIQVTGKESCKDMTLADYMKLKRHYRRLQAGQRVDRQPTASKSLRALYAKIDRRGAVQGKASVPALKKIVRMSRLPVHGEEPSLNRLCQKVCGVMRWEWLTPNHAWQIIEALKSMNQRQGRA